ncbi:MAG: hypothetical protein EAZ91_00895 [Cytophagales bacterium]|nr:MAG: hypothetical protein EAZ91_00895 [Cytophagales bacterium]
MFVNSRLNGFWLLLSFGLLCGLLAGSVFGFGVVLTLATAFNPPAILVFVGLGAVFGGIHGVVYGLSSYYIKTKTHWRVAGVIAGALPSFIIISLFGWYALLFCVFYGLLVSEVNIAFPSWWGMRLRAEGIDLLRHYQ